MAESTVVEGPTLDSRPALPLIAGGVVVAGAAVLALLIGPPSILLGGCVLAGFGITYMSGIALTLEERLAFGTVLGAMAVAVVGFPDLHRLHCLQPLLAASDADSPWESPRLSVHGRFPCRHPGAAGLHAADFTGAELGPARSRFSGGAVSGGDPLRGRASR